MTISEQRVLANLKAHPSILLGRLGALMSAHWHTLSNEPCPTGRRRSAYEYLEWLGCAKSRWKEQGRACRWMEDHGGSLKGFKP